MNRVHRKIEIITWLCEKQHKMYVHREKIKKNSCLCRTKGMNRTPGRAVGKKEG